MSTGEKRRSHSAGPVLEKRLREAAKTGEKRKEPEIETNKPNEETEKERKAKDPRFVEALLKDLKSAVEVRAPDVVEIFSEPRITEEAKKFGLKVGEAMDIKTGWDFNKPEDRARAKEYIQRVKPKLVVGCPMCKMFSRLQCMSPWTQKKDEEYRKAVVHLKFVVEIYEMQIDGGRFFLHEHPEGASSWELPEIKKLMRRIGVWRATGDQCMYGLSTRGETRGAGNELGFYRTRDA